MHLYIDLLHLIRELKHQAKEVFRYKHHLSTFDVSKIVGIPHGRLRHWTTGKFVPSGTPTSWGSGYKAGFTYYDLYSIGLFKLCRDMGMKRSVITNHILDNIAWRLVSHGENHFWLHMDAEGKHNGIQCANKQEGLCA